VKLLGGARDQGLQSLLVMISLFISWMTLLKLLLRHLHLPMRMIGKKQFVARWTQFSLLELGSWLIDHWKEGKDFIDTNSHVARLITIRVLLTLAISHGLLVHQMDVKTAFLNRELEKNLYHTS
jgi:hypothetical protein